MVGKMSGMSSYLQHPLQRRKEQPIQAAACTAGTKKAPEQPSTSALQPLPCPVSQLRQTAGPDAGEDMMEQIKVGTQGSPHCGLACSSPLCARLNRSVGT